MSNRGIALKGKDVGIYVKVLKTGEKRYMVRITFIRKDGSEGCRTQTVSALREARKLRDLGKAKRTTGVLKETGGKKNTSLGEMVSLLRELKRDNRNWKDHERYLNELLAFFGENLPISSIDEARINRYKNHLDLQECGGVHSGVLSNQSKDHRLKELRSLLNIAHDRKLLERVPVFRLYRNYGEREYNLDLDVFHRLLGEMPEAPKPHRAILLMGLVTGMRKGDLLSFPWRQYDKGRIRFRSSKTQKKDFTVSAPKQLQEEMSRLWNYQYEMNILGEFAFLNPQTKKPYTDLSKSLERASRVIGLKRSVTLHMFRHLAGDQIAQVTGNEMFTQQYIGWSSPEMVRRYTHIQTWTHDVSQQLEARLDALGEGDCKMET